MPPLKPLAPKFCNLTIFGFFLSGFDLYKVNHLSVRTVFFDNVDLTHGDVELDEPVSIIGILGNDTILGGNNDDELLGRRGANLIEGLKWMTF